MDIEFVEKLTLDQKFRLVEIAHETKDQQVKQAAIDLLQQYLYPPIAVDDFASIDRTPNQWWHNPIADETKDQLEAIVARWLQEAKRFRDGAKAPSPDRSHVAAILSWELQASIFEKCANEISQAFKPWPTT